MNYTISIKYTKIEVKLLLHKYYKKFSTKKFFFRVVIKNNYSIYKNANINIGVCKVNLEKDKVIEKIKEGKNYGLSYSKLARIINMQPISIYMFMNGTNNLSQTKQLEAVCVVEKFIEEVKEIKIN